MAKSVDRDLADDRVVVGGDVVLGWIDAFDDARPVPMGRGCSEGDSDTADEHEAQNRDCFFESWGDFHLRLSWCWLSLG